jgi:NAD-dependent deacetylase
VATFSHPERRLVLHPTDRVFILAGAGVSAESGIPTFRGVGGLWRNYRIEEVASPEAWHRDPRLVWEFYSMRRRVALAAKLNPAHFALAKLESMGMSWGGDSEAGGRKVRGHSQPGR